MGESSDCEVKVTRGIGLFSTIKLLGWLVAPLAVMYGVYWWMATESLGLFVTTFRYWEYAVFGFASSAATYLAAIVVSVRWCRATWLAAGFAWFYLLLCAVNAAMLYHAGTLLEGRFLWLVDWTNWTIYLTDRIRGLAAVFVLACVWVAWLIRQQTPSLARLRAGWFCATAALLWLMPVLRDSGWFRPAAVVAAVTDTRLVGTWRTDQGETLKGLARNPLGLFVRAILHHPTPLECRGADEIGFVQAAAKEWRLPLGLRRYPSLSLKPFDHIVVFGTESLSLDFLSPYNHRLLPPMTPFYGSGPVVQSMFTNYWTAGFPSQQGIVVTYGSHPNADALLARPPATCVPKILARHGYRTIMLKSDSETFLNDRAAFQSLGFQEVVGVEAWEKDSGKRRYIEGRGLMDRILYEAAVALLEKHRGQKVFLHVVSQDTHFPDSRRHYGDLSYPATPAGIHDIANREARNVLESVFRHDYDLGLTLAKMRERRLLTEQTLVVITADHNCPAANCMQAVPGFAMAPYARIPLCFLSGQALPPADRSRKASQLDFAPSLAHLLNLSVPPGWWGESLFCVGASSPYVRQDSDRLLIESGGEKRIVSLAAPAKGLETDLIRLFHTVFVGPDGTSLPR